MQPNRAIATSSRRGASVAGRQSCSVEELGQSLDLVQDWVEQTNYCGYEPFDGLSSWARPLALGNIFAERALIQLIRQCPLNLRPLLGVSANESTKGRGYMAAGYISRYRATKRKECLDKSAQCLNWLDFHKVPKFEHHSWSNHFDFVSRGASYTKDDPIIVWTCLIGFAYLEAFEVTAEQRWLRIADSVCRWIMELPREMTSRGVCLSYLPGVQCSIHNSNLLGAAMLARTARHTGNREQLQVARSAMEYSCSRQLPSGAWWYAEEPKFHWIDNFHTGYNLTCVKHYLDATEEPEFRENLERGLKFFKENFFEDSGRPKYYHDRTYPVDIQCAAQAIETLALLEEEHPACLGLARRVASWTIVNMQDREGYFYYRQYPLMTSRTPMLHWGQATMFRALALLYEKLSLVSRTEA